MAEMPPKKSNTIPDAPFRNARHRNRRMKKKERDDINWKKNGHLPRSSMKRKYIGTSQETKTSHLLSEFRIKTGGYTSMPDTIKKRPKVRSIEYTLGLGLVLVKCDNL
jgi:hypothetical protein